MKINFTSASSASPNNTSKVTTRVLLFRCFWFVLVEIVENLMSKKVEKLI